MFITVKAVTNAAKNQVIQKSKGNYIVKVTATAERGKANKKMIQLLAGYFGVSKLNVSIVKGKYSSKKIINIIKKID